MFKNLMTKIKTDLEREQTSANGSVASSLSSSRLDLGSISDLQTNRRSSKSSQNEIDNLQPLITIDSDFVSNSPASDCQNESPCPDQNEQQTKLNSNSLITLDEEENVQTVPVTNNSTVLVPITKSPSNEDEIKLLAKIEALSKENKLLKSKMNSLQSIVAKVDLLEKENSIIFNELKQMRKQNQDLMIKNEELRRANIDNEERNTKLLNKMDQLKEKNRQLSAHNEQLNQNNESLTKENEKLGQTNRKLESELEQCSNQISQFEEQLREANSQEVKEAQINQETEQRIHELEEKITQLNDTIAEKNKTIRLQNQRISDIKKSMQKNDFGRKDEMSNLIDKELSKKTTENEKLALNQVENQTAQTNTIKNKPNSFPVDTEAAKDELFGLDINFQYLHNIIFKFITTYDHEAQKHLIKAISTLLRFSDEEQKTIKQSLESRNSWFRLSDNFKF